VGETRGPSGKPWRAFLGLLSAALVIGVHVRGTPIIGDDDCFIYAKVARSLLGGDRLYQDVWEAKPPLAFGYYAPSQLLAPGSFAVLLGWMGLWGALTGALFFGVPRARSGVAPWMAAAFVSLFPLTTTVFDWPSTEHASNLFVTALLLIAYSIETRAVLTRGMSLGVGALTCACFHTRQNTLLMALVPLAAIAWSSRLERRRKLAAFGEAGLGFALAWALILAFVALRGSLSGYAYAVFAYPRLFARAAATGSHATDLALLLGWLPRSLLAKVALAIVPFALWGGPRRLVLAALAVSLVACPLPMKPCPHYWMSLLPAVALALFAALDREALAWPRWALALAVAGLLGYGSLRVATAPRPGRIALYEAVARRADRGAGGDDRIFVAGEGAESIAFCSRLRTAGMLVWDTHLEPYRSEILPESLESVLAGYHAHPPAVIVVDVPTFQKIQHEPSGNVQRLVASLLRENRYAGEQVEFAPGHEWWIFRVSGG
jgi:hypothetical protein